MIYRAGKLWEGECGVRLTGLRDTGTAVGGGGGGEGVLDISLGGEMQLGPSYPDPV